MQYLEFPDARSPRSDPTPRSPSHPLPGSDSPVTLKLPCPARDRGGQRRHTVPTHLLERLYICTVDCKKMVPSWPGLVLERSSLTETVDCAASHLERPRSVAPAAAALRQVTFILRSCYMSGPSLPTSMYMARASSPRREGHRVMW